MYICRVAKALPQPVDLDSFFRERITRTDQICVRILQNCSFSVNLQSYWIHIDYRGLEKLVGTPSLLLSSPPPSHSTLPYYVRHQWPSSALGRFEIHRQCLIIHLISEATTKKKKEKKNEGKKLELHHFFILHFILSETLIEPNP